ncbi:MAG TPA: tyrosine-type recombinase/integrase [Gammaproteobacteria bacterium]
MPKGTKALSLIRGLELHIEDCMARGQSTRTAEGKRYVLSGFIAWCLTQEITLVQQVTIQVLEAYRKYLFQYRQPNNKKPLDIATQRNRLTDVVMYFRRLRKTGYIRKDPGHEFEMPYVPRRPPQAYLSVEEIEAICRLPLLYGIKGCRDRTIIEVHFATGIRRAEVANLDISDIDFKEEIVIVRQGKGRRDRRVPIAKRALAWVKFYVKHIRPRFARVDSGNALFLTDRGKRFEPRKLGERTSRYVKLAGINKRGGSTLFRHSTATLMLDNGADIRHVQEMMGHADIKNTQIYTHVAIGKLKEVYKRTHPAAQTGVLHG